MYRRFLAYKYVFRIITLAALLGVAYSVTVLIVVVSVMEGFRSELESRIRGTTSDIRVESSVFVGLQNPDRIQEIVSSVPGVESTAPIVEMLSLFRRLHSHWGTEDASDRTLLAFDLENESTRKELDDYIASVPLPETPLYPELPRLIRSLPKTSTELFSDRWFETGLPNLLRSQGFRYPDRSGEYQPALVGSETLRQEGLLPGSTFELTSFSPVPPYSPRTERFRVIGYFKTGLYELDAKGIFISLTNADRFLGLRGSNGALRVSAIRTTVSPELTEEEDLVRIKDQIDEKLRASGELFVKTSTWREEKQALLNAVKMEKFIVSIILGVVILFSGFMIFIILTVQVVERTRDIGVVLSVGGTPKGVATSYFLIGASLCIIGTLLGTVYGVCFSHYINTIQHWIKLLTGYEVFPKEVYYLDHIPVKFNPSDLLSIIIPTVAASLVASLVPALRAATKDPSITLRYK